MSTDFEVVFPLSMVGGQNAADDHARVHVPRLRLKVELDGDAVLARLVEQVVEFAESLDGKRAGRFQEHLEDASSWPQTSGSARHAFMRSFLYPVQFAVRARSGAAPGS